MDYNDLNSLTKYYDKLISFLSPNRHWWEYHSTNYFIDDFWNSKFPEDWKTPMLDLEYSTLLEIASNGIESIDTSNWPISLIEFITNCRKLPLIRDPQSSALAIDVIKESKILDKLITVGMSDKKVHEVQRLAGLIEKLCIKNDIENIVDLGAGQGYLDFILSYCYQKTVIGVDDDTLQTCGAIKRSQHALKVANRKSKTSGRVYHINRRINVTETFQSLLKELKHESGIETLENERKEFLLCGLHTCGDLSPASIQYFLKSDSTVLVNVGCCYNRLSEIDRDESNPCNPGNLGFPLSDHCLNVFLGHSARTLACQSICRWSTDKHSLQVFEQHYHRALLQKFIVEYKILPQITDTKDIIVGHLNRGSKDKGWLHYVRSVFDKWNIILSINDEEIQQFDKRMQHHQKEVAIIWTLRAMLAESIESLILIDRLIYILEQNAKSDFHLDVDLVPLFDYIRSPRNLVIVCEKKHRNN